MQFFQVLILLVLTELLKLLVGNRDLYYEYLQFVDYPFTQNGNYNFTGLLPDTYLDQVQANKYFSTLSVDTDLTINSDHYNAYLNYSSDYITLGPGETNNDIDLGGYYLTDDFGNMAEWTIPDTTIEANGYLIVWADKDTLQTGLHTNFKLSSSGESLVLSNSSGNSIDEIEIKSQKSAGASWVANQIVVWANSLNKNNDGKLIKSIGLLDGDQAGIDANTEINRVVKPDSAGANSFKVFKLKPDYAKNIIPICQKGLIIPITLEELYPPELWKYAETKDWLEERNKMDELLKDPKSWNKWEETLKDYISRIGLSEDELIYLKTFKLSAKEKVVRHIVGMGIKEKTKTLQNFEKLVSEMIKYLNK